MSSVEQQLSTETDHLNQPICSFDWGLDKLMVCGEKKSDIPELIEFKPLTPPASKTDAPKPKRRKRRKKKKRTHEALDVPLTDEVLEPLSDLEEELAKRDRRLSKLIESSSKPPRKSRSMRNLFRKDSSVNLKSSIDLDESRSSLLLGKRGLASSFGNNASVRDLDEIPLFKFEEQGNLLDKEKTMTFAKMRLPLLRRVQKKKKSKTYNEIDSDNTSLDGVNHSLDTMELTLPETSTGSSSPESLFKRRERKPQQSPHFVQIKASGDVGVEVSINNN